MSSFIIVSASLSDNAAYAAGLERAIRSNSGPILDHGLQDMHQNHDSDVNNQQSLKVVPELCREDREVPFGNGFPTYFRLTQTFNLNGCVESNEPLNDVVFANCTQVQHLERLSRVVSRV